MSSEKILALDLGHANIKMAYFFKGKMKERVCIETPLGSYFDGKITNTEVIASLLKREIKERKWKVRDLAVTVNASTYIIRQFKIPKLVMHEEIIGALELQISETLSTILDSHSLSYSVYDEDDETMSGILVLMPKELIETYVVLADMLELTPTYMDIHPNAVSKLYKQQYEEVYASENAIIIDFGAQSTNMTLTRDGKVLFNRFVPGGSNMIDEMLERELGLDKSQTLLCRLGQYSEFGISDDDMRKFVRLSCMRIEDEIRQIIDFFTYNKLDGRIGAIVLHGSGARLTHFYEHLKSENAIPVHVIEDDEIAYLNLCGALLHRGNEKKESLWTKRISIKLPKFLKK